MPASAWPCCRRRGPRATSCAAPRTPPFAGPAPALWRARAPPDPWGAGPPPGAPLQGPPHPRHAAGPHARPGRRTACCCARRSGTTWCLPDAAAGAPTFTVVAVHDPRYREPLLLASPLPAHRPGAARPLPRPLAGRATPPGRQTDARRRPAFVHAPETCQRLPELALLAGAILSYARRPPRPSPPASGIAAPSRRLAACAAPSRTAFSARLPAPCTNSRKSGPHGPSAHGLLGATPPLRSRARGHHRTTASDTMAWRRVSYRKLKLHQPLEHIIVRCRLSLVCMHVNGDQFPAFSAQNR